MCKILLWYDNQQVNYSHSVMEKSLVQWVPDHFYSLEEKTISNSVTYVPLNKMAAISQTTS